ncbi:MAG TPA: cytochrome c3 family protein [Myxococcales bacterium]|nr:cytochrome c3 family protein [Myxococcales bacterium]
MNGWLPGVASALVLAGCGSQREPQPSGGAPGAGPSVVQVLPPEQPFHFDHRIHAGKYQIPCLTCHTSADHSTAAGIPTIDKCMGCHRFVDKEKPDVKALAKAYEAGQPVAWNRVHRLPDHVYFSHERHVLAGVACQKCHGPVETMQIVTQVSPLTMGWCVQCHKENHAPATDCLVCHK